MAYDRNDRGGDRDERWRWSSDERERGHRGRDERGFFERAGEEISSWFGGSDERGQHDRDYRSERGGYRGSRGFDPERENWMRDRPHSQRSRGGEDRSALPTRWSHSGEDYRQDRGSSLDHQHRPSERDFWNRHSHSGWNDMQDDRGYRPMAGDYGRSGGRGWDRDRHESRSGFHRDESRPSMSQGNEPRRFNRSDSEFDSDEYRRTSFAGSTARSNYDDRDYHEARRRHMDEFDRDYHAYRSEQGSKFESDFGGWREQRQSKRGMLRDIREHMEVVGNDGRHVGTIDRVAGDRLILTKSDPEAGGVHHSLSCTEIDRIEGDRLILGLSAERARERWRDESRERALFEREDQGRAGPHVLDRSFSGTYR